MVFTNPSNPVGTVYSSEELGTLLRFAKKHDLHILSDEVYSLSVDETEEGQPPFVSFAKFVENDEEGRARVTVHWGLSKDFGLHGFRFSCLHTYNTELLALMRQLSYLYELPSPTQSLVANVCRSPASHCPDAERRRVHQEERQQHARGPQGETTDRRAVLRRARHPLRQDPRRLLPLRGSQVRCTPLPPMRRRFMREPTAEEEQRLCKHLYANGGVFVSPGASYHSSEPGWFRVVFTANSVRPPDRPRCLDGNHAPGPLAALLRPLPVRILLRSVLRPLFAFAVVFRFSLPLIHHLNFPLRLLFIAFLAFLLLPAFASVPAPVYVSVPYLTSIFSFCILLVAARPRTGAACPVPTFSVLKPL